MAREVKGDFLKRLEMAMRGAFDMIVHGQKLNVRDGSSNP